MAILRRVFCRERSWPATAMGLWLSGREMDNYAYSRVSEGQASICYDLGSNRTIDRQLRAYNYGSRSRGTTWWLYSYFLYEYTRGRPRSPIRWSGVYAG